MKNKKATTIALCFFAITVFWWAYSSRRFPYTCFGTEGWSVTDIDRNHVDVFNFATKTHEIWKARWHRGACIGTVEHDAQRRDPVNFPCTDTGSGGEFPCASGRSGAR